MSERQLIVWQRYFIDSSPDKIRLRGFHGFGDYLRGCICLYQLCQKYHRTLLIDFSYHPLAHFLLHKVPEKSWAAEKNLLYEFDISKLEQLIQNQNTTLKLFTNCAPLEKDLSTSCIHYIRAHCLHPNYFLSQKIMKTLADIKLSAKEYDVLHIRIGDAYLIDGKKSPPLEILQKIRTIIEEKHILEERKVLILSDCTYLKLYLWAFYRDQPKIQIYILKSTPIHCGHHTESTETLKQMENTLIEFFLLTGAGKIHQISAYSWGSGFSTWASKLYQIPLQVYLL